MGPPYVWERLTAAGADLGVVPFGVEAQRILRLEKGHIIVGQDTDGLTQGYAAGLDWAIKLDNSSAAVVMFADQGGDAGTFTDLRVQIPHPRPRREVRTILRCRVRLRGPTQVGVLVVADRSIVVQRGGRARAAGFGVRQAGAGATGRAVCSMP
jgi:glycine cleavage system aminomethyltransferase T